MLTRQSWQPGDEQQPHLCIQGLQAAHRLWPAAVTHLHVGARRRAVRAACAVVPTLSCVARAGVPAREGRFLRKVSSVCARTVA